MFLNLLRPLYSFKFNIRQLSTIFALSSGQGKCGVAVIRVSGPSTKFALKSLTGLLELPKPRNAILRSIKHPTTKEILDKGLVLWFPGPYSFTGEDCCEFHVHGGVAVINSVLEALGDLPDLQLAQPGEFTRRAFFNGKLDLTEVEGLADLLQAETEAQRKQAFLQTHGALSKLYNKWRKILMRSLAHMEAHIDFDETEDVESGILDEVITNIILLKEDITKHLNDGRKGELLRNGVKTVIIGEPNVGKSSLLNLLCKRPAAIVTPIEGTTRDVLEVTLNIGGYPLVLADTAGLRSKTYDVVEKEGINRAIQKYKDADLVIIVLDLPHLLSWLQTNSTLNFSNYLNYYLNKIGINDLICKVESNSKIILKKDCLIVLNKLDLIKNNSNFSCLNVDEFKNCLNFLSCQNEEGVFPLIENLTLKLKLLCGEPSAEHPSMNQRRHRQHLNDCLIYLLLFLENAEKIDTVLSTEYLRKALKQLGYLVGKTTTDQLLDIIFKDFCIGK